MVGITYINTAKRQNHEQIWKFVSPYKPERDIGHCNPYGKFLTNGLGSVYIRKKICLEYPELFPYFPVKYRTVKFCLYLLKHNIGNAELLELTHQLVSDPEIYELVKHIPYFVKLRKDKQSFKYEWEY